MAVLSECVSHIIHPETFSVAAAKGDLFLANSFLPVAVHARRQPAGCRFPGFRRGGKNQAAKKRNKNNLEGARGAGHTLRREQYWTEKNVPQLKKGKFAFLTTPVSFTSSKNATPYAHNILRPQRSSKRAFTHICAPLLRCSQGPSPLKDDEGNRRERGGRTGGTMEQF